MQWTYLEYFELDYLNCMQLFTFFRQGFLASGSDNDHMAYLR